MRAAPVALLLLLTACGGGGTGSSSPPPSTNPPPSPPPSQDPCASIRSEALLGDAGPAAPAAKSRPVDGTPTWRVLDALWTHRDAAMRRVRSTTATRPAASTSDVGEISVVRDEGDVILPANPYDLKSIGLRFSKNQAGGYDIARTDAAFRTATGTQVTLRDDDSVRMDVPFAFPFYSGSERAAFVNSDGNITFREGDSASTERNVPRLLTGPPRVALFLADLDPSAGGGVLVNAAADQYTVTWCNVRGFDSSDTTTAQATLLPDGTIEMRYASTISLPDAVVGLSPGATGDFTPVDFTAQGSTPGGGGAVGERFSGQPQLDTVALARAFYRSHPDAYDQLLVWTDTRVIQDAFAFEVTIANQIEGIGVNRFDFSRDFGSGGQLQSYTVMDFLGKYPDDPQQRFLGENNTLSLLGQEVGHRWLVYFDFRDHAGQRSDELLGRDRAHWSFFMDSDASVMEGNDIEDLGGGSFRTTAAVRRYSRLDQYAMGLIPASDVPSFFYVANPTNVLRNRDRDSAPEVGVTFNGTRRDVLIADIIAVNGVRSPAPADSPRVHRQAFVYVVGAGRQVDPAQVARLDRIRREWQTFFAEATEDRMGAETRLFH